MSYDTKAKWKKGKRVITGSWYYHWASDTFTIRLDGNDPGIGLPRYQFAVSGEHPEFNGWKLVEKGK